MIIPMKARRRRPGKVALLHGAVARDAGPDERDVLVEVDTAARALADLGYGPVAVPLTLDLDSARRRLLELRPSFVFNLVESIGGKGRLIHLAPALLDSLGLPYTGAGTEAMFLSSNKLVAKRLLAATGIDTPAWAEDVPPGACPPFPGPYIVKSVWEDASIGIGDDSVVADPRRLSGLIRRRRRRFGGEWFAERFIDGREFNLALLAGEPGGIPGGVPGVVPGGVPGGVRGGVEALPPAEMCFVGFPPGKPRIVDYAAKWDPDSFAYRHTVYRFDFPDADRPLLARLEAIAKDCWRRFGLRGYARVDFRVDAAGRPWVLEVNANPCISPDAGFAAAAARAGLDLAAVVRRILADTVSPVPRSAAAKRSGDRIGKAAPAVLAAQ